MTGLTASGQLQFTPTSKITPYPGYEQQNALAPLSSSDVSSDPISTNSEELRLKVVNSKRLSAVDQGCFLTGVSDVSLEPVYIINAVPGRADLKAVVESFITTWLRIADPDEFHLRHMSNVVFLLPTIHRHIDTYSTIVVTCCENELVKLIDRFEQANEKWQSAVSQADPHDPHTELLRREEIIVQDPAVLYDIVILKPSHFLPFSRPLLFRDPPVGPIQQGQPIAPVHTYSTYTIQDRELCATADGSLRPPFVHVTARTPETCVNALLWVLNASWKFEEFQRRYPDWTSRISARGQRLMHLTEELAAKIYFRPTLRGSSSTLDPLEITVYRLWSQPSRQPERQGSQPGRRRRVDDKHVDDSNDESRSGSDYDMGSDTDSVSGPEDLEPHTRGGDLTAEEGRQIIARITNLQERQSPAEMRDLSGLLLFGH